MCNLIRMAHGFGFWQGLVLWESAWEKCVDVVLAGGGGHRGVGEVPGKRWGFHAA